MRILIFVALACLLGGCLGSKEAKTTSFVCQKPYITVGTECCLDRDANGVCDRDETTTTIEETTTLEETTTTEAPQTTQTTQATHTTTPLTTHTTLQQTTTTRPAPTTTSTTQTTTTTATTTTGTLPCHDTDVGQDGYVKGTATRGAEHVTDYCLNQAALMEFFCRPSNQISSTVIQCPKGCLDGRCVGCTDTDGGDNPAVYGETSLGTILMKKDLCSRQGNGTTLQEYFCVSQTEIGSRMVDCPISCADGKCI